jgi:putative ATPase
MSDPVAEVECPICQAKVPQGIINKHIDSGCEVTTDLSVLSPRLPPLPISLANAQSTFLAGFFSHHSRKRVPLPPWPAIQVQPPTPETSTDTTREEGPPPAKKVKRNAAEEAQPLAERMRPKSLDQLIGHEDLVGENGVLRELILTDRVPSMILWAGPGVCPCFVHDVDV